MSSDHIVHDGLSGAITKLDTLFTGSEITEITQLQQQEITLKLANLTSKDVRTIVFGKKEFIVEEIGTPTSTIISKNFMVGDVITKVNGKELESRAFINNLLTAMNTTTVVLKRRAYASIPDENRLRNTLSEISQTRQKGFAYQVITCNKMRVRQEKLVESTFGFRAVVLGGKFVVVKIAEHSAAEKFFSIGDSILDLNGRSLRANDPKDVNLINPAFQKLGEITILVERPVTSNARKDAGLRMGQYLAPANTEPTMADDAILIGKNAANYHRKLWKRLEPISIVMETGHKASPKKRSKKSGKKKKGEKDDECKSLGDKSTTHFSSLGTPRVIIDPKRNCIEITSDSDPSQLEKVGSRYVDDFVEKDDKSKMKKKTLFSLFH
ncbi:hypothetical protein PRIPAC_74320 [Pristionchus pacificus]|uniref:Uncharacterized protein n=1 Tax=Pristionchus pacificus TaxID=54126 RepID=A0A2A6CZZ1_PRIPA|nr:hypothetical protein PRIPAC_74320 [Pristionchus pacificus]|eukprot:PDM83792.1 hypothetical protein PRIPAC_30279 [Pristionchus pacificus]